MLTVLSTTKMLKKRIKTNCRLQKAAEKKALTSKRLHRKGQVRILKESDRARGIHCREKDKSGRRN